jgi:3',5'-cyclic AMP phosphodiesterase CpdA
MQRKTLLYVFGIAALSGLALGIGFFGAELRQKIAEEPDKSQFEISLAEGGLPELSEFKQRGAAGQDNAGLKSATMPAPAAMPASSPNRGEPAQQTKPVPGEEPEAGNSFSFAIIGDTPQFDPDDSDGGLRSAVKNIKEKNVDLVMATGDLLEKCDGGTKCEKELNDWKSALGELFPKTYAVMGNYDRSGEEEADALWQKFFDLPKNGPEEYKELAYSLDFENSHFVVLNSEKPDEHKINEKQRDWLEKDLSENQKENIFVFFHEPAWPVSEHIGESLDKNAKDRDALWKILKDHGVSAVFSGHEHIISRKKADGIYQYIFGNTDAASRQRPEDGMTEYSYEGKGYGIIEVKGKKVTVRAYSVGGELLDTFEIPEEN